jgi:hypothetical protein
MARPHKDYIFMMIGSEIQVNITVITSTSWESAMLVLLMGDTYELCRWDGLKWRDKRNKFHKYLATRSEVIKGHTYTETQTCTNTDSEVIS